MVLAGALKPVTAAALTLSASLLPTTSVAPEGYTVFSALSVQPPGTPRETTLTSPRGFSPFMQIAWRLYAGKSSPLPDATQTRR